MERGRPKQAKIRLSAQEHADLQVLACSRSLPHSVLRRAQMILMAAEGYSNTAIAEHFGLTLPSVGHWRKRHLSQGIAGLYEVIRSGRPRSYDADHIAALLNRTPNIKSHIKGERYRLGVKAYLRFLRRNAGCRGASAGLFGSCQPPGA